MSSNSPLQDVVKLVGATLIDFTWVAQVSRDNLDENGSDNQKWRPVTKS
jgi:hypothetical protein